MHTHHVVSRVFIRHPRHRDGIVVRIADDVLVGQEDCGSVGNHNDVSLVLLLIEGEKTNVEQNENEREHENNNKNDAEAKTETDSKHGYYSSGTN